MSQIPERVSRYQIAEEVGRGAMGVVYRATDPNIGRTVALKTMRLDMHGVENEEILRRFKHEAVLAGVMNHPNIVTIYDAGEYESVFYIAMEYIEGVTLHKVLHEQRALSIEPVLNISRQVCAGLDYAHDRGVIHRDIKPANIMMGTEGAVKIMDFGIAKSGTSMTTAGQVLGTPTYMSPEQVRGRQLDGRSDLFSFGVCLYEMVTGEKPFTGQNVTTIIYKIMNEAPIPPRDLDVSIHPGISAIISKALAKNPDERYQNGEEMVHDLENYKSFGSSAPPTRVIAASATAATASGILTTAPSSSPPPPPTEDVITAAITSLDDEAIEMLAEAAAAGARKKQESTVKVGQRTVPEQGGERRSAKTYGIAAAAVLVALLAVDIGVKLWRNPAPAASAPAKSAPTVAANRSTPAGEALGKPAARNRSGAGDTVKPTATEGVARITTKPAGAMVTIGGATQPNWITPFSAGSLTPGVYEVTVSKSGYLPQTKDIEVAAGNTAALHLDLAPTGARITVSSQPRGAAIWLDGKSTGRTTPAVIMVEKGSHLIQVRKAGFREVNTSATLNEGENYNFAPSLEAQAGKRAWLRNVFTGGNGKAAEGTGLLVIRSNPAGAQIFHDKELLSKSTPMRRPTKPGTYTITLKLNGYKPAQRQLKVEAGKTTQVNVPLEPLARR